MIRDAEIRRRARVAGVEPRTICALRCARAARDPLAQPDDPRNLFGLVVRGAVSAVLTGCLRDGRRGMRESAGPTGERPGSRCSRSARRAGESPNWAHSSSVSGEAAASGIKQAKSPAFDPAPGSRPGARRLRSSLPPDP